ncbi:hypothetical protein BHM03_00054578 [Ensete ventricosum]|nr:hypothetical protein BHM03_00054578 [Ensete ventricosum]
MLVDPSLSLCHAVSRLLARELPCYRPPAIKYAADRWGPNARYSWLGLWPFPLTLPRLAIQWNCTGIAANFWPLQLFFESQLPMFTEFWH